MFIPYPDDVVTYSGRSKLLDDNYLNACALRVVLDDLLENEKKRETPKEKDEEIFDAMEKIIEIFSKKI